MPDDTERIEVTESELLAAVLSAECGGHVDLSGALTTGELAERLGWTRGRTLDRIKAMKKAGAIRKVGVKRDTVDDKLMTVAGWQLVQSS